VRCSSSAPITHLLARWSDGDRNAREELIPLVYDELRRLARSFLARRCSDHTLQSTALVHEAYLRLVGHTSVSFENRTHFFAVAALMRRILVDHARKHNAARRGGKNLTLVLDEALAVPAGSEIDFAALVHSILWLSSIPGRPTSSKGVFRRPLDQRNLEGPRSFAGYGKARVDHGAHVAFRRNDA